MSVLAAAGDADETHTAFEHAALLHALIRIALEITQEVGLRAPALLAGVNDEVGDQSGAGMAGDRHAHVHGLTAVA